ncbi:MAG: hypothetical protein AAF387_17925, partial [Pseudomonadota bacterium]
ELVKRLCDFLRPSNTEEEPATGADDQVGPIDAKLAILDDGWGHYKSKNAKKPINVDGAPLPWFTYPTIEFLQQLDFTESRVLEWGAGGSTLFWGARCNWVFTLERNLRWHEKISSLAADNTEVVYAHTKEEYLSLVPDEQFDIIVIDGELRRECVSVAVDVLAPGGLIILDNSDWYTKAAEKLRIAGFVQIDFSGFGPVNDYTWSTSLYLRGDLRFKPMYSRLPVHGVGSLSNFAVEERDGELSPDNT